MSTEQHTELKVNIPSGHCIHLGGGLQNHPKSIVDETFGAR